MQDWAMAVGWYEKAAKQGNPTAQCKCAEPLCRTVPSSAQRNSARNPACMPTSGGEGMRVLYFGF